MPFKSHGSVAASVRRSKEANPEMYCAGRNCLWRLKNWKGEPNPCPRHQAAPVNELQGLLEQSVAATQVVEERQEQLAALIDRQEDLYYEQGIKGAETLAGDIAEAREALAEVTP